MFEPAGVVTVGAEVGDVGRGRNAPFGGVLGGGYTPMWKTGVVEPRRENNVSELL